MANVTKVIVYCGHGVFRQDRQGNLAEISQSSNSGWDMMGRLGVGGGMAGIKIQE